MDPTLILLVVALGAFIIFQVFQGRKRRRETEDRVSKFVPGVEIMTNYGLYGTILSIDEDTNVALVETTPGTVLKIHRQTILKVADYAVVPADDDTADADQLGAVDADQDDILAEPAFGERTPGSPTVTGSATTEIGEADRPAAVDREELRSRKPGSPDE